MHIYLFLRVRILEMDRRMKQKQSFIGETARSFSAILMPTARLLSRRNFQAMLPSKQNTGLTLLLYFLAYVVMAALSLPGTLVYVNAGTQLAKIQFLQDILSPTLIFSFLLLGIFPLIAKSFVSFINRRRIYAKWPKPTSMWPKLGKRLTHPKSCSTGLADTMPGCGDKIAKN